MRGWMIETMFLFSIFFASSAVGGRTLATSSLFQASSELTKVAPAALYCSSESPLPLPAPDSILILAPAFLSFTTWAGVRATRSSPMLIFVVI